MRRILVLLCCMSVLAGAGGAEPKARVGGGLGWLYTPELNEFNDIPTVAITRGGGFIGLQALFGRVSGMEHYWYGAEVSFLRSYRYEYHVPITTEVTLNSFPVLAIAQYDLMSSGAFTPFLQGGIGVAHNRRITEIGADSSTDVTNDFTVMVGPGFSIRLNRRVSLDVLLQYYIMFTKDEYTRRLNLSTGIGFSL